MKINVGDRVAYSVQWLKSTGQSHSDIARARGIVEELIPLGKITLAVVEWNDDDIPNKVLSKNLAVVGPSMKFCQC